MQIKTVKLVPDSLGNSSIAYIGVSVFFILSGACLMYVYQDTFDLKTYLKKRFLSIYPLYWVSYVFVFLFHYVIGNNVMANPKWTFLLSFLGMDGYLAEVIPNYYLIGEWFVGCIILLYLVFPLLRKAILIRPKMTAVLTAVIYIVYIAVYPLITDGRIDHCFLSRIPEFMFGMYYVLWRYQQKGAGNSEKRAGKLNFGQLLIAIAVFLTATLAPPPISGMYLYIVLGVSVFCILDSLFQIIFPVNKAWTIIIHRFSGWTFSVFLVHHYFMGLLLAPYEGMSLNWMSNGFLFLRYFVVILFIAGALRTVTNGIIRLVNQYARRKVSNE